MEILGINEDNIKSFTNEEIDYAHSILHVYFSMNQIDPSKPYGFNKSKIELFHSIVVNEILSRGGSHEKTELLDDSFVFVKKTVNKKQHLIISSTEEMKRCLFNDKGV